MVWKTFTSKRYISFSKVKVWIIIHIDSNHGNGLPSPSETQRQLVERIESARGESLL